jgi:hypothetical protein
LVEQSIFTVTISKADRTTMKCGRDWPVSCLGRDVTMKPQRCIEIFTVQGGIIFPISERFSGEAVGYYGGPEQPVRSARGDP